ncbi:hypothetical protein CASFOL_021881 [Castilleja foliolosa]|uniref:Uncharacterized protein n=1 Tax=Castilleja foliolosa TaxID=1961234 RepID=A0ABD3CYS2_9LAMI
MLSFVNLTISSTEKTNFGLFLTRLYKGISIKTFLFINSTSIYVIRLILSFFRNGSLWL